MRTPATAGVVVEDGTTIAYHCWEADEGVTADPIPVVLQHGFTADTMADWLVPGTVAGLTAAGRRVVGVDARGHGRSAKSPDAGRYGERRMANDLLAVIALLGLPAVDLVGYSMGAVVALLAASQTTVRRLVVGGVGAGIVEVGGVDTRALPSDLLARALLAEDPEDLPPGIAGLRAHAEMLGADLPSLAAQARAVHRTGIDLAAITAETLVIAGDADPLAERPHVLAEAIAGASLRLIAGGHEVIGTSPEFRSAVIAFLGH
ncbi:alpha/beta hydrolase [Actinoplanes ianthinogenes]|uniref:Alpha/beta hydrolase n=1 Tax=Actinoplanes ianthinogenes TaxID=122358 RepID=A0ABM7M390_9ACTN|nr:alpha/beta hydrolase [Actinoplanes ianthinogenes]BCJ46025.1 alpha/beta hydrolase [Actinoplanes ianthinogenes]GGR25750.1 alpha/beta hydrolase [Actinoplanes ianthinogenes]